MSLAVDPNTGLYPSLVSFEQDIEKVRGGINEIIIKVNRCVREEQKWQYLPHLDAYQYAIEDLEDVARRSNVLFPMQANRLNYFLGRISRLRDKIINPPQSKLAATFLKRYFVRIWSVVSEIFSHICRFYTTLFSKIIKIIYKTMRLSCH